MSKPNWYMALAPLLFSIFTFGCADQNGKESDKAAMLEAHTVKCAHYFQVPDKNKQEQALRIFNEINADSGYVFSSVQSTDYTFFLKTTLDCTESYGMIESIYVLVAYDTKEILRIIPRDFTYLVRAHVNVAELESVLIEDKELQEIFPQ